MDKVIVQLGFLAAVVIVEALEEFLEFAGVFQQIFQAGSYKAEVPAV